MQTVERRFAALDERKKTEDYNFEHFTTGILLEDGKRTIEASGICPGELAPDFELPKGRRRSRNRRTFGFLRRTQHFARMRNDCNGGHQRGASTDEKRRSPLPVCD